jgi:hypothetical protein
MRLVKDDNRANPALPPLAKADPCAHDPSTPAATATEWPAEVDMILSAMEAVSLESADNRRRGTRSAYRVCAQLRLFADMPLTPPTPLYTRDLHARGIGFITQERLPLGYGGIVDFTLPNGTPVSVHCTVYRCREAVNGWFEGALHFSRDQEIEA